MFNNRFNSSKNDPLVEAVKQARADGDMRRQAIAAVNEQFGVFSRNAVVREDLAAYDAAIEEAYKCMKEGKPVLAKKDYDKDGKIESPKDEVWGSRFRAAKMAGKMEEGSAVSGEDPGMEVAKKAGAAQQSQTPSSTPARTGNAAGSTISNARSAAGMNEAQLDELKKPTPKTAMKALQRASDSDDVMDYDYKRTNRLYKWKQKHLPGKSARNQKSTGKADLPNVSNTEFHKDGYPGHVTKGGKLTKKAAKDTKADIKGRLGKHTAPNLPEDYQLDELTGKGKLPQMKANYQDAKKIHSNEADWHAARADRAERRGESKKAEHHMDAGYGHEEKAERAGSKLKRANALMTRAKAAADIKSSKAASKSARAEYKEEVMKESIKAKLLAKHMKESQIDEVSAFGQAFRAAGGKNFTFGGKTYSGARADGKSSASASAPTSSSGPQNNPGLASAKGFPKTADKPIGDAGYKSDRTVSLKPIGDTGSAMAADNKPEPPRPAPIPGQKSPAPVNQADTINKSGGEAPIAPPKVAPTPPSRPANLGGSAPAAKPMQNPDQNITKVMKESVQVGVNKYRIV